jgi:hypothetical protein
MRLYFQAFWAGVLTMLCLISLYVAWQDIRHLGRPLTRGEWAVIGFCVLTIIFCGLVVGAW